MSELLRARLAARYARFADDEARGRSPLYEAISHGIAKDRDVLDFLLAMPREKQQPNLLLASVRHLFGVAPDWPHFREILLSNTEPVRQVMLTHSTQTNEPARCATLLPVLARLQQPLAIIEVGASAGLCLLPDFYSYDYGRALIRPAISGSPPVFSCKASPGTPLPNAMPQIAWRAGLDLKPIDAADPSQSAWLEALVWPEQTRRLENLRAALRIAASYRPSIVQGDLLGEDLARLCRQAPTDATLVVFHAAVLPYVTPQAERRGFADRVRSLCHYWISNESPHVLPDIATSAGMAGKPGRFVLSLNGSPLAWTDPHGAAIEWIERASA